jgi:hypothetical protein
MELWLLAAGAVVLIAITIWIVWPATTRSEEGTQPMEPNMNKDIPPQGERFEDQYTAATADLSAGGVAGAVGALQADEGAAGTSSRQPWSNASEGSQPQLPAASASRTQALTQPKTLGMGAGALLTAGGAVGGAWLYSRWLERRNKPINRLRRGARGMANRISERWEDADLPEGAAPVGVGGVASAVLLSGLLLARAMRREEPPVVRSETRRLLQELVDSTRQHTAPAAADLSRSVMRDLNEIARSRAERLPSRSELRNRLGSIDVSQADALRKQMQADASRKRVQADALRKRVQDDARRKSAGNEPKIMGIGLGGLAAIAGASFVVWRLLRPSKPPATEPWYGGMGAPGI